MSIIPSRIVASGVAAFALALQGCFSVPVNIRPKFPWGHGAGEWKGDRDHADEDRPRSLLSARAQRARLVQGWNAYARTAGMYAEDHGGR